MDNMQLVNDKITEYGDLYTRMDSTRDLVQLKPYELKDYNGKTKIDQAISVTRNTPAWQAFTMANKILKAKWQTVVDSSDKMSKSKIRDIEQFSDDAWAQIDEFLEDKYGMAGGAMAWWSNHVVVRSWIGARIWTYYDDEGNLVIDFLPLDMRWCPFENKEWYCNITYRSAASIIKEYQDVEGFNVKGLSGTNLEIRDFWDGEIEEVYVDKKKIGEKENVFGTPPFVVMKPSVGFMLQDSGYIKYEGEDALFLDRALYDEMNRLLSIAQTLGMDSIKGAFEQPTPAGEIGKPAVKPPMPGETVRVAQGEEHRRIERGDLKNAFLKAANDLGTDIERGGMTDTEAGNNASDRSALWVTTQNELLGEKLQARIDTIAGTKRRSMRMIIDQCIKLAGIKTANNAIGVFGMKHNFTAEQLGDPATYRLTYKPMLVSKSQNIANIAVANAQKGLVPHRFILEETLQVEDPDGLLREMDLERAKQADPSIALFEMAIAYAEEAETLSGVDADAKNEMSRMLTDSGVLMRRQRRMAMQQSMNPQGQQVAEAQEIKPNSQGLMALAGSGGNQSTAKVTAEAK